MENFDTVGYSIKKVTKNAEKPMSKNVTAQTYEAFKLVSFPAWPVTEISKSANLKNFDIIGKSSRAKTQRNSSLKINLPKVMRC